MAKRIFITLLLLLLHETAMAYGPTGHRVVGALAQDLLTIDARREVDHLLEGESLADVSTWADEMRSSPDNPEFWGYDHAANWHFINTEPGKSYAESAKSPYGDAYMALETFIAILRNQPIPDGPVKEGLNVYFGNAGAPENSAALKSLALRFLVHIVGDLHQPMHVAYAEDRGGNLIPVRWFGRQTNLHSVWDSRLVNALADSEPELRERLNALRMAHSASQINTLMTGAPSAWIEETAELRDDVYRVDRFRGDFGEAYVQAYGTVAEEQLFKAGVRLAGLLNDIFSRK